MPYIDANGVPIFHELFGEGEPVVFLHGGFCSAEVMRPLGEQLTGFEVHAPERPGHGRTPDRPGPITYDDWVADTVGYLDAVGLIDAHLVGFADGANLGLMVALAHPERVRSLVAISANLQPDVWVPEEQQAIASPAEQAQRLADELTALSPEGPDHVDDLLGRLSRLWTHEPHLDPAALAAVTAPTLVVAADHDMVRLDHTALIADSVPGAQLCVVPGTSHLLVRERPELIGVVVSQFLQSLG